MKPELQKKLDKLPAYIDDEEGIRFLLNIAKCNFEKISPDWQIDYRDIYDNTLLSVIHSSLQAAVDNTLSFINKVK